MKQILHGYNLKEIESVVKGFNQPIYRAKQLKSHLNRYETFEQMTDLPKAFLAQLEENYTVTPLKLKAKYESKDGSCKYLFELADSNLIESVFLPHDYGNSVCVSSQVGCSMGCVFCASGAYGLTRNLTCGEILAQVLYINAERSKDNKRAINNVVMMGSGSPLDNYDNSMKFIDLLTSSDGLNISVRSISLSTCGIAPKIKRLADDGFTGTLSISLHAASDEKRKQIMKIARAFSISEVINSAKYFFNKTKRRVVLEYALINEFNDTDEDVKLLQSVTRGYSCHVNLIILNKVDNCTLTGSSCARAEKFCAKLNAAGVSATLRKSMGNDVAGACGQLKNRTVQKGNQDN